MKRICRASGVFIFIYFFNFFLSTAYAGVPNEINYQGIFREYGQPVTGARKMSFNVYATETDGTALWSSGDLPNIQLTNGIFSVTLEPSIDLRGKDLWLEVWISDKKLSPREKLTSNWYALHSRTAEDIEKSSGENIHFAIGSSTIVAISGTGLEVKTGGIKFPDSTVMTTAGAGDAASVTNNSDTVITGDADGNGSGDVKIKIGSSEKFTVPNAGEVKSLLGGSTFYMIPRGAIIMWAGTIATIPSGWGLCDGKWYDPTDLTAGQSGQASSDPNHYVQTPDLTDRFILSVANSSENPGGTGGSHSITLAVANLPAHSHTGSTGYQSADHTHSGNTSSDGNHSHTIYGRQPDGGGQLSNATGWVSSSPDGIATSYSGTHSHSFTTGAISANHYHGFTTNSTGSGSSFDNRPTYYKIAFIMKL